MKIKIEKQRLKKVLEKIQGITSQKTSLQITKNVIIETVSDNEISIKATDLTSEYFCTMEAEIENKGIIAVNSRKFFDIVKYFPDDFIPIEEIDFQWIKIGTEDVFFHLVGASPEDFPGVSVDFNSNSIETDSVLFKKMITAGNSIHPETNELRPFILGINIYFLNMDQSSSIKMFSTDTKRIVKSEIRSELLIPEELNSKSVLVPKKIIPDLIKFIDDDKVNLSFTTELFTVRQGKEIYSVNILEGDFPDCSGLIVPDEEYGIEIDKYILNDILQRVSIVADEKTPIVFFNFSDNTLTIASSNPELGEAKESTGIVFDREGFETAFNARYIMDILKDIQDDSILLYLKDKKSHCIIKGCENIDYAAAIMPIKI
ncbi:MAG: DNA polymerase III subunit beta [Desulfobacteraceae bacterium]|jgi:DNA polymerase-3 subunit beta|nr:DNA polymerase III subunit beta [Desulfobacteraceae bacterium]